MRHGLFGIALIAMLICAGTARAVETLAYSFETTVPPNGPDGFFGLGGTVTHSALGSTNGLGSLQYNTGNDGFVGARTESVIPLALNNPPGVEYVLLDILQPAAYPGTFADLGVTIFGHDLNPGGGTSFGNQVQFSGTVSLIALGAGQRTDVKINLGVSQGGYRPGETFNQIFGTDDNDLSVASAFQFYISKSAGVQTTIYIDNVRLGSVPEPATFMLCGLGCVALGLVRRRSRG